MGISAGVFAGVSAAGGVMKAAGQYQEGKQQEKMYDRNALIYDQKGAAIRQAAELNDVQAGLAARKIIGQQIAGYAGSGVASDTGSPLEVMTKSLKNSYLDRAISKYNSEIAARSNENEASNMRMYGKDASRRGKIAAFATLVETAGKLGASYTGAGLDPQSGVNAYEGATGVRSDGTIITI